MPLINLQNTSYLEGLASKALKILWVMEVIWFTKKQSFGLKPNLKHLDYFISWNKQYYQIWASLKKINI